MFSNPLTYFWLFAISQAVGLCWWLGKSHWDLKAMLSEQKLIERLKEEFVERVPSGWIFNDGQGL